MNEKNSIQANPNLRKKINKILLISPPGKITITKEGSRERKLAVPPLGLAYLASNLIKEGYEVEVLDTLIEDFNNEVHIKDGTIIYGLSYEKIKKRIQKSNPDIVGISCIISNRTLETLTICKIAKEISPDIHVVLGGQHPSGMPEIVSEDCIDYVLTGESDNSLTQLITTINEGSDLAEVKGIALKNNSSIYINPHKDFPDVNSLPLPAWHIFNLEKYWNTGICDYETGDTGPKKFLTMITSRGCPHKCYFCTSHFMSGRKYRLRDIDDVINEIQIYRTKYNINRVYFWDDNFFAHKQRVKKLLRALISNFSDMTFEVTSGSEVNSLDDEIIELMPKAGFKKIFLAVESPNEDIQHDLIDKNVNIKRIPMIVRKIHEVGMIAEGSFMVGFPSESKKQIDNTFDLAQKFNFDRLSISIVNPLPGTPLYKHCQDNNLLYEDFDPQNIRWSMENIKLPGVERGYIAKRRRDVWVDYMKNRIDIDKYENEKVNSNKHQQNNT